MKWTGFKLLYRHIKPHIRKDLFLMNDSDIIESQNKTYGHVIKEYLCQLHFQVHWYLSEIASRRFSTLTSAQEFNYFWGILPAFPLHDQTAALVFQSDAKNVALRVLLYSAAGAICHTSPGYTCTQVTFTPQHFYPAWFPQLHADIPLKHFFYLPAPEPCWYCGRHIL